jgi:hypothetical protein
VGRKWSYGSRNLRPLRIRRAPGYDERVTSGRVKLRSEPLTSGSLVRRGGERSRPGMLTRVARPSGAPSTGFPFETAPRSLLRDREGIYGAEVRRWLESLHIEEVVTAPRSPWQNP